MICKRVGDEMVLVHLGTDRIYTLNDTGARIWELLEETGDPSEVRRRLLEEYEVDAAVVESEIETFLAALDELKLRRDDDD